MICRSKSGKTCWNYSERIMPWRSAPIPSDQSYYSNIKKCQTNLDLLLFFAWSAAMHSYWNIRNFAHEKIVQSPQVSTGFFFCTPVIRGSVAEWSAHGTRNPAVLGSSPALLTCWICSQLSRVQILGHTCKQSTGCLLSVGVFNRVMLYLIKELFFFIYE